MTYLVATAEGLFQVEDSGRIEQLIEGGIRHVVASDEGAVALADDATLWSLDDDGASVFQEFDPPPRDRPLCLVVDGDDVWMGTAGAHLLLLRGEQVVPVEAFDRVAGRGSWYTPSGGQASARSIDVDDDSRLYVAVHVGGIVRSLDGQTWEPTALDIDADVHQVVTVPGVPEAVIAPCARGLASTADTGETWQIDAEGLHATYSRAAAVAGDTVVLSVSTGPDGQDAALYWRRLDDVGGPFRQCTGGIPERFSGNIDTHCIAAWDELVVAAGPAGGLYVSTTAGVHWKEVAAGLPQPRAVAIL